MPQPTTHRWNIDARFNTSGREQMPQIVVSNSRDAKPSAGIRQRLVTLGDIHHFGLDAFAPALISNPFEKPAHFWNHRNRAHGPVLRTCFFIAAHKDFTTNK